MKPDTTVPASSEMSALIGSTVRDLMTKSSAPTQARIAVSQSLLRIAEGYDSDGEATRNRAEAAAFEDFIRRGKKGMKPHNLSYLSESRDMFTGGAYVGSSVGFLVPTSFKTQVESAMKDYSPLLDVSNVIETDDGRPLSWPQDNDASAAGELIGEGVQAAEQDIQGITAAEFKSYIFSSKIVTLSLALLQDQNVDIAAVLSRLLATRISRVVNQYCTVGLGATASQPMGFLTAAQSAGIAQGASVNDSVSGLNSLGTNDVVGLERSVDVAYRANARFFVHPDTLAAMRNVKDRNQAPVYPGLHGGKTATIFGYPVNTSPFMDPIPANPTSPAQTYRVIAFGDYKKFVIRRARPTLLRLRERFIDRGVVGFLMLWRHDSALVDAGSGAIKYLEVVF